MNNLKSPDIVIQSTERILNLNLTLYAENIILKKGLAWFFYYLFIEIFNRTGPSVDYIFFDYYNGRM